MEFISAGTRQEERLERLSCLPCPANVERLPCGPPVNACTSQLHLWTAGIMDQLPRRIIKVGGSFQGPGRPLPTAAGPCMTTYH